MSTPTYTMPVPLRTSTVLTVSEVFHEVRNAKDLIANSNQVTLYIDFTAGSLTSALIKMYTSQDGVTWYAEPVVTYNTTTGEGAIIPSSLKLTTNVKTNFLRPINTAYLRFGVQGVGSVIGSLLSLGIDLGTK